MTINEMLAPAVGSVAGTVTDENGPVVGVSVTAINSTINRSVASTTTASNGTYVFAQLPTAEYVFRFDSPGLTTRYNDSAATAATAPVVQVASGANVTGIDTVLSAQATITGHVTSGATPLAGVAVVAYDESTGQGIGLANTAADGSFTLDGLGAGGYTIGAVAPNNVYAPQVVGTSSTNPTQGTVFSPTAGGTLDVGTIDMGAPLAAPGAPTGVSATGGNSQATVSWTAPVFDGGSTITGYTVTASSGETCGTTGALTCTVTGLTNGTTVTFTVTATNALGTSPASADATPITIGFPTAPTGVTAVPGNGQASVSWTAPVSDGGSTITGYTVTASTGQTCTTTDTLSCVVTGLTNGTAVTFTVTATNTVGTSSPSSASAPVAPGVAPDAPTYVSATLQGSTAEVNWVAPYDGGSPITGYTVTASTGQTCTTTGALTCTVTGLTYGTAVTFTVTATNALGTSSPSTPTPSRTPTTVPGTPTGLTATVTSPGYVTLNWTAPTYDGFSPIQYYLVHVNVTPGVGPGTTSLAVGTAASITYNGGPLPTDSPIEADITAYNANGVGVATAPLLFYAAYVPGAPTGVTAVAGDGQATVFWNAPASNGGSTITGYTVTASNGQTCTSTDDTTCTVTGLTNGTTYNFTVTATNRPGTGPASDASASVLVGVPGAPTGVAAVPGIGQATVSWNAPTPNGGPAITGYTVTASTGQTCSTTDALSCVITGLASGTAVTFTVTASNEAGTSISSAPSAAVTTIRVPDAPTAATAHAGNLEATVIWSAPFSDGGSAVTGYTVTASTGQTCSTTDALTCVVTGLASGTAVTFTVTATNEAGTSIPSVPSNTITPFAVQ